MKIQNQIETKIKKEVQCDFYEVINESPNHNVPDGAESVSYTHLTLPTTPYV